MSSILIKQAFRVAENSNEDEEASDSPNCLGI